MKLKMISLMLVLLMLLLTLTACDNKTEASEPSPFKGRISRESIDGYTYVHVDRNTGVCYMSFTTTRGTAMTVMLNADGTPLTYAEAWEQAFGEGHP